ncbi:MAG TPA: winged helix-turn-helix domain-containing protein [Terracidiphilus sp.]|nr:winged helix-turn-helix domain-containing protein [Terracidiphilus sp.]
MTTRARLLPAERRSAYRFGNFNLTSDGTLLRGQTAIHLSPKELSILRFLLSHAGSLVSPAQLKTIVWKDLHVTDESVPRCVSSLRARLQPEECIDTEYKRGYRISLPVERFATARTEKLPRLAILPFDVGPGVPEYMGHTVAEEASARLAHEASGRVTIVARDSCFALAAGGATAQKVGEALEADLVLAGNLRAFPSHWRLRTEMLRVEDGVQIWSEDVLVAQAEMAAAETELARRLVARMGGGLSIFASAQQTQEPANPQKRHAAYDHYQRGRYEWRTLTRHRMQDGLQTLFRAMELDPGFIPAQVDLVNVCITQALYGFMEPGIAADQVRRVARGIPAEMEGSEAMLPALGWVRFHVDHDLAGALEAFAACEDLPHDPWTTRARVMFALSRQHFGDAIAQLEEALSEDPYSPWLNARLGWALHLAGAQEESVAQAERTLELFPTHDGASTYGSSILAYAGQSDRALRVAEELAGRSPYFDMASSVHAYALICAGRPQEAREVLERMRWLSRERYVMRSFNAASWVLLEDFDAAIASLRHAEATRCPWFFQTLADPRLKALHGHPEFEHMRRKLTHMEAALTSGA